MTSRLTKKQEEFAVLIAKGEKGAAAYRATHNTARMTQKSVHESASRLLRNAKVAARVDELRAPALEEAEVDVKRWMKETSKYAFSEPSEDLKHGDKRAYLDMVGRSVGAYEKDNAQKAENLSIEVRLVGQKT